jgi:hypothetical protein
MIISELTSKAAGNAFGGQSERITSNSCPGVFSSGIFDKCVSGQSKPATKGRNNGFKTSHSLGVKTALIGPITAGPEGHAECSESKPANDDIEFSRSRMVSALKNAPEFDYSSFYAKTRAGDPLLCGGGLAFLMTGHRTAAHEEAALLSVLKIPFRQTTPDSSFALGGVTGAGLDSSRNVR